MHALRRRDARRRAAARDRGRWPRDCERAHESAARWNADASPLRPSGEHTRCVNIFLSMKAKILKKFEDEVALLERELKTELPREIQRARELGDLRENAEYHAAKDRQTIVNSRIAMLKKRIAEIAIMNLDKIPHDKAAFGSTVHLNEDNGERVIYQLVMPEEADAAKGLISTSSPIGRAIVGKTEGDAIKVVTPNGTRRFEIVKLVTIHDEA